MDTVVRTGIQHDIGKDDSEWVISFGEFEGDKETWYYTDQYDNVFTETEN